MFCFPPVFNYVVARHSPYPLIYHNPRIATQDCETGNPSRWDSAQRSAITLPSPSFHPRGEERVGCVIPDWRLEVAWHLREWRSDVSFIILCNDLTAFALLCLNYEGLELRLRTAAATKTAGLFLRPRRYNLSAPAITPPGLPAGRQADGLQHCRKNSL